MRYKTHSPPSSLPPPTPLTLTVQSTISLNYDPSSLLFTPLGRGWGTGFTAVCNLIYMRASLGIYVCYVAYNYSVFSFRLGSTHPRPHREWCEMHSHTHTQSHSHTHMSSSLNVSGLG